MRFFPPDSFPSNLCIKVVDFKILEKNRGPSLCIFLLIPLKNRINKRILKIKNMKKMKKSFRNQNMEGMLQLKEKLCTWYLIQQEYTKIISLCNLCNQVFIYKMKKESFLLMMREILG